MAKKKKAAVRKKTVVRKKVAKKATKRTTKTKKTKTAGRRGAGLNKTAYSLSSELQAVVGTQKLTRPQIVKKLWAYIKSRKCQDAKNRRLIVPDAKLAAVIGNRPVDMLKLAGLLSKHIR